MRITIDIDDNSTYSINIDKTSAREKNQVEQNDIEGQIHAVPPPELSGIAAETGAQSAGLAPAEFIKADIQPKTALPDAPAEIETVPEEDQLEDEDAGSAPSG